MKYTKDINDANECLICIAGVRTFCGPMSSMQNVAKIHEFGGFKKLPIPVLNAMKWRVEVGVEKTSTTAGRRSKTVLATIQ